MVRPSENIDKAVRQCAPAVDPAGAVCTGWVLVAEWQDSDGRWWLTRWSEDNLPPWRADGLLYHATNNEDIS